MRRMTETTKIASHLGLTYGGLVMSPRMSPIKTREMSLLAGAIKLELKYWYGYDLFRFIFALPMTNA